MNKDSRILELERKIEKITNEPLKNYLRGQSKSEKIGKIKLKIKQLKKRSKYGPKIDSLL